MNKPREFPQELSLNQASIIVKDLSFSYGGEKILDQVSLEVYPGEFVGIIGPNGSGKSTLLKNLYKVHKIQRGNVSLMSQDVTKITNRQMAGILAVVAQERGSYFDFTVAEIVAMGRYAKHKMLGNLEKTDQAIVKAALAKVDMLEFAEKSYLHLSGGEKQRVLLARALAQETPVIVLDEPTNHLDIGSQINLLNLIKDTGKTVLAALHDLNIAANYCQRIYVIAAGKIIAAGRPREVITADLINELYGIRAEVFFRQDKLYIDY